MVSPYYHLYYCVVLISASVLSQLLSSGSCLVKNIQWFQARKCQKKLRSLRKAVVFACPSLHYYITTGWQKVSWAGLSPRMVPWLEVMLRMMWMSYESQGRDLDEVFQTALD